MNFLAHFYLGRQTEEDIFGNFIGDFVKGSDYKQYRGEVERGILMHRCIDDFTDKHHLVSEAKQKLDGKFGHYAGVVIDVFYDYFLANNWNSISAVSLPDFIEHSYSVLGKYQDDMPFSAQIAYRYMVKNDWLNRYNNFIGLQKTFVGLNAYVKRETGMEYAVKSLIEHKDYFDQNFMEFFPQIEARVLLFKEEFNK